MEPVISSSAAEHTPHDRIADPLLEAEPSSSSLAAKGVMGLVGAVGVHAILGAALVLFAPFCNAVHEQEVESNIEVAMVEVVQEVEIEQPEPEIIEPEPEPVVPESEPEIPEPEPEPEPPKPEPEPPKPEPKPVKEDTPPPPKEEPPASMKPVELEGLSLESTTTADDAIAIKVGQGITSGKITTNYVDPSRMGDIITGDGNGDGSGKARGSGTSDGTRAPGPKRVCKDKQAKAVTKVKVPASEYPAEAKRRGLEGTVVALLSVNKSGEVTGVTVVKGAGYGFDELAKGAFMKWKFEPAEKDCAAVDSKIRFNYAFNLDPY